MNALLNFLNDNKAILIATMLSLITQLWHSVEAFANLSVGQNVYLNYTLGIFFAISTSFAILVFTIRGRMKIAYFYLAVEVFINVMYYRLNDYEGYYSLISLLFLCLIVPVTISIYSKEINTDKPYENEPLRLKEMMIADLNDYLGFDIREKSDQISDADIDQLRQIWLKQREETKDNFSKEARKIINKSKGIFD